MFRKFTSKARVSTLDPEERPLFEARLAVCVSSLSL